MKLLLIQETNWIDRNPIQTHHLMERLSQRGHQLTVIDYDILWPEGKNHSLIKERRLFNNVNKIIPDSQITVIRPYNLQIRFLCHLSWGISSLYEMNKWLKGQAVDVLLCASLSNSYLLAKFAHLKKIPFIYLILEPYHAMVQQKWLRPIARAVEKSTIKTADQVFVFTPKMKDYAQEMGGKPSNIVVFHSGVNSEIFQGTANDMNMRQSLGIREDEWVIFFMGWLYEFCGMQEIVHMIGQNPIVMKGIRLLIVGDGDIYQDLKAFVEEHQLGSKVLMVGKRPYQEIPALLSTADVCLMPSLENEITREIVPMKVYEYMACGKPVVVCELPGLLAEFGNDAGIFYVKNPIDALKKAVAFAHEPSLAAENVQKSCAYARKYANWGEITDHFEKAIKDLISHNKESQTKLSK